MYYIGPNADLFFFQQVKRRVEEREAEQVAAMMNMVPPWQEREPQGLSKTDRSSLTPDGLVFWGWKPFDEQMECNVLLTFPKC